MTKQSVPAPMEALLAAELPEGDGWQYEPKWDGFRCLAHRDGAEVTLTSRSGKPLGRYFPEVVEMLGTLRETQFLLDGELIIPRDDVIDIEGRRIGRAQRDLVGGGNGAAYGGCGA